MDTSIDKIQKIFFDMIEEEIKKNKIEGAINISIASYFFAKGREKKYVDNSITHIYVAFSAMFDLGVLNNSEKKCSFCGRHGEDIKLGAGPDAYICGSCVTIFASEFSSEG